MRFRAKVASFGFKDRYWAAGEIVEVRDEEAKVVPHHFEKLGDVDPSMREEIDKAKLYDSVQPPPQRGPIFPVRK